MEKYGRNATIALSNVLFQVMVRISYICKGPLKHMLLWQQKATARFNRVKKQTEEQGRTYLGETPLSKLVCGKGQVSYDEVCASLLIATRRLQRCGK